jgi:hypothetical protein
MWLLLWVVTLYALFVHALNIYVSGAAALIYLLWYLDGKEYTGERHWPQFRRFILWRWLNPITYHIPNALDLEQQQHGKLQRIYILRPGNTYFSVLWGIGLHGGKLPPKMSERLHWVVPPLLMAIPLLRDILLWAGAVTYHERKHPLLEVMLGLLNGNRSVCYCPAQYANTVGEGALTAELCTQMLRFAKENATQIVPIVVSGERQRYHILETPSVLRMQRWMLHHAGYPFPMLVALRCCGQRRPPGLALQFGGIMYSGAYESLEVLQTALNGNLDLLRCEELGDVDKVSMV